MPITVATLISTIAVVIGFADLPYGYYMLLRLLLCSVSLFFLFGAKLALTDWEKWTLGGFAVLYNPLMPIRIGEKAIWEILNVITVVLFLATTARHKPR
jgi:hypothetical protein